MTVGIDVTTMGFSVRVSKRGVLIDASLDIYPYSKKFENIKWNNTERRYELKHEFFFFDEIRERCYFPRFDLDNFLDFLREKNAKYALNYIEPTEGTEISYLMLPFVEYKSEIQKNAIEYISNEDNGPIRGLALQTGQGKSISFIWGIQRLGRLAMITMTSRLEQWCSELKKYTTLEDDDIYVIQGVASLTKLFNQIGNQVKPKIILASTKTIRLYIEYGPTYQHLPHPSELTDKIGIGIIGTDEYHEHFFTNYLIGMIFNAKLAIPITATFLAPDPFVNEIFKRFIPQNTQFVGGGYKRYVNVTAYMYESGGMYIKKQNYTARGVYSQVMFENFLMSKKGAIVLDSFIHSAIIPIMRNHYSDIADEGEKLLILCATKGFGEHLLKILKKETNRSISTFFSGMNTFILEKTDIIISTPGSAGTGRDIKNLRTCIVLENTSSEIRNLQFIGRLRDFPSVKNTPEYCYISFRCIPAHVNYANKRAMLYGPRALQFRHRSIR